MQKTMSKLVKEQLSEGGFRGDDNGGDGDAGFQGRAGEEMMSKSNVIAIIERYKVLTIQGAEKNYLEHTPEYKAEISKASLLSLIIRDIERRT